VLAKSVMLILTIQIPMHLTLYLQVLKILLVVKMPMYLISLKMAVLLALSMVAMAVIP